MFNRFDGEAGPSAHALSRARSARPGLRRKLGLFAVVAALMVPTACSASGGDDEEAGDSTGDSVSAGDARLDDLYDAAKEEGEVTWYTASTETQIAQVTEAWEELYPGVQLTAVTMTLTEATQRIESEIDAGADTADIMLHTGIGTSDDFLEKGWSVPMSVEEVPTLEDFPDEYVHESNFTVSLSPTRLVINTDLVTEEPTSYEDLLGPDYEDAVFYADPRSIPIWMDTYNLLREEFGIEFLSGLVDNGAELVDSAVTGVQRLAAGEAKALLPAVDLVCASMADTGAPVKCLDLAPSTAIVADVLLIKEGPHPSAGRLFASFLASEDGQIALNKNGNVSPLGNLEGTTPMPEGLVATDPADTEEHTAEILEALGLD